MNMDDVFIDEDDDVKKEEKEEFEVNNTASSRIKNININGSILPMEQRSGESKCRIPLFVLNDNLYNNNDLPLVLYQKNDWSSITELEEDDSSITSNDPMDLD
ncbi:hypothetical protein G6F68_019182 [Rhizopus microsporus]|nr:hypothetical protein G6F68_019182 [Rhizopus microsporus]